MTESGAIGPRKARKTLKGSGNGNLRRDSPKGEAEISAGSMRLQPHRARPCAPELVGMTPFPFDVFSILEIDDKIYVAVSANLTSLKEIAADFKTTMKPC